MKFVSRTTVEKGLSDVSLNLSAFWLAIVLSSPGLFNLNTSPLKYFELLIYNFPPAILSFAVGLFFMERSSK